VPLILWKQQKEWHYKKLPVSQFIKFHKHKTNKTNKRTNKHKIK